MAMLELTGRQRRHLRAQAHALKPLVQVGRQGLTPAVLDEVGSALGHHELVKVRLAVEREERQALARELAEHLGCGAVGLVGQVAILYRPHSDPAERRIELPS
jgi:RNA-binding protein